MNPQIKRMRITVEGKAYDVTVELLEEAPGRPLSLAAAAPRAEPVPVAAPIALPVPAAPVAARPAGAVPSPLSGMVLSVDVGVGQVVKPGDLLVTLEAMKMKTPVRAPAGGTVKSIAAKAGVAVEEGAVLLVLG